MEMTPIHQLQLGFNDAENYKQKDQKDLFNQIFIRTDAVDTLTQNSTFFIIGEKGTGKTAHAVYLTNNAQNNILSDIKSIRETDYQQFVKMKQEKHLVLSDYTNIWKIILYLLMSEKIQKDEDTNWLLEFLKFKQLKEAIDEYYAYEFSPEILYAIQFAEEANVAAELLSKYANVSSDNKTSVSFSEKRFQTNLLFIQRKFESALNSLKLKRSHIIFIDGIDIRPGGISYNDYLDCVKGLANAVWSINNDFFSRIKDSQGRLRIVLLMRPDIFDSIGLQNRNNKIRDNSVLLDWRTAYAEFRTAPIFKLVDKLFSSQQNTDLPVGTAWDHYFPYTEANLSHRSGPPQQTDSSFIHFLRISMYRPRDFVTMIRILREIFLEENRNSDETFRKEDVHSYRFMRDYSNYLLGEVKDQLSFYHSKEDYDTFLNFFNYLHGSSRFDYDEYIKAYQELLEFLNKNSIKVPKFFESPDSFLQFLYELNVIAYEEYIEELDRFFYRWCFRERSTSNVSPKVMTHKKYRIHYGLARALNLKWKNMS